MKKTLRKLEAIIAIALVLTIGGVYATFNYAQEDVQAVNSNMSYEIEEAVSTMAKGTITVSAVKVKVVNANNDNKTSLEIDNMTVSFKPADWADANVTENGIKLKLTIAVSGKYTDANDNNQEKDIYTLKTAYTDGGVVLNDGNEVKDDIAVDLSQYIQLTEVTLATKAMYDDYKTAFESATITVTVSEYKPA